MLSGQKISLWNREYIGKLEGGLIYLFIYLSIDRSIDLSISVAQFPGHKGEIFPAHSHSLWVHGKNTCRTGSGTLFLEQAITSCVAVSKETLCPTDTYTGLEASSEVRNACTFNEIVTESTSKYRGLLSNVPFPRHVQRILSRENSLLF